MMCLFSQSPGSPDVKPEHFWSKGPLVNHVRSWQFIIKHDLTYLFQEVGRLVPMQSRTRDKTYPKIGTPDSYPVFEVDL